MHYAAMRRLDDRLEVLTYLLDRKHDSVNHIMYQDCGDEYHFHMYSGIGTPLHFAAAGGLLDLVKLLVQYGALPRMRDPAGRTAADWARRYGHEAILTSYTLYSWGVTRKPSLQMHRSATSDLSHWIWTGFG